MTQLTPDEAEKALECLSEIVKDTSLHSPVYFDTLNMFAAQSYSEIAAKTVARIAVVLEGNGLRLTKFDVLQCDTEQVLLLRVEAQS